MAEEKQHSLLSASTSHRWLACTPSVFLEKQEPQRGSSPYAQEGTEAHELGELKLRLEFGKITQAEYNSQYLMFKARSQYWSQEFEDFVDEYVNLVKEQSEGFTEIHFELKVDYGHIIDVPDHFGTCDCVIVFPDKVTIVDLKYGKGVLVEAENNSQLSLYALAACQTLKLEVSSFRIIICQPRLDNFSSWDVSFVDLWKWGTGYARQRAQLAKEGKGDFCPGEKQCRFCKLAGKCNARADVRLAEAKDAFDDDIGKLIVPEERKQIARQVSLEKLAILLEIAPLYAQWLKDVEAYAYTLAMSGTQIPGYKLVQGRTVRKIDNEEGLVRVLKSAGFQDKDLYKPAKLKGLGDLEELVGKRNFEKISQPFVTKPAGEPTLVPESDKRAPINMAQLAVDVFSQNQITEGDEE